MDPLSRLFALEHFGIKLGLGTIRALCEALDHPEHRHPSIHIAGTNGKGSVAAMVDGALRAAGWRTGRYTSPHLSRLEERFAVDGQPAQTARVTGAVADVLSLVDRLRVDGTLAATPTFFEVTTAAAFLLFARAGVDVAVVEVGLGGRFDATNVITPAVAAITSIDFDHERHLGSTLARIAAEKAGIAKPGVPLLVGPCHAAAMAAIAAAARAAGAPMIPVEAGVASRVSFEHGRATLTLTTPVRSYPPMALGLAGRHQVANAIVAVRVIETFEAVTGRTIGAPAIAEGLTRVRWPARLEWMALPDGRRVLLDAAHNPAGSAAFGRYLDDLALPPLPIVVAVMRDKDTARLLAPLVARAALLIATEAPTPRTLPADALAETATTLGARVVCVPDAADAVARALELAATIAVAGSIFLVGPVRDRLQAAGARPT
jgi:dihydrofolate synthase/folylpolyglutamate synthase